MFNELFTTLTKASGSRILDTMCYHRTEEPIQLIVSLIYVYACVATFLRGSDSAAVRGDFFLPGANLFSSFF